MDSPHSEQETGVLCDLLERLESYDYRSGYDGKDWEGVTSEASTTIRAQAAELERLRGALENSLNALQRLHTDIDELMADSEGVYGLHANGDPSPWEELQAGGQFEDWLGVPLWAARNAWRDGQDALASNKGRRA